MRKPKQNHQLTCGICNLSILIPGEEYCNLTQYTKENKFYKEMFYHVKCFADRYIAKNKADVLMEKTMKLLNKAESRFV